MATPKRPLRGFERLVLQNQLTLFAAASCMPLIPDSLDRQIAAAVAATKDALDKGVRDKPSDARRQERRHRGGQYKPGGAFAADVGNGQDDGFGVS